MAKFCKECGKPLDEDSKFCKECGAVNEDLLPPTKEEEIKKGLTGGQIALIVIGIVAVIGIIVAIVCSNSCGKQKDATLTSAATTAATTTQATKEETLPEVDPFDAFKGTHTAEDTSKLYISGTADKVAVTVDIYKLGKIDMEGTFDGEEVTCKGLDPNGGTIEARIFLEDEETIRVEFTNSTWEYIKTGDHFDFGLKK